MNSSAGRTIGIPGCPQPRNVYIDLGVNWCNTIQLFADIDADLGNARRSIPYEVYGFEASPLIQPFAEQFFAWLNGQRKDEPVSCLPRSGSSIHLNLYASAYGCPTGRPFTSSMDAMRKCMFAKLKPHLQALRPNPQLNDSALISARLDLPRSCPSNARRQASYTLIPAAAAAGDGMMLFDNSRTQLIRGGALPVRSWGHHTEAFAVPSVNIPSWIQRSFSRADHVILKIDIEGGEHHLMDEMIRRGLLPLIDVLSLECHESKETPCASLLKRVRNAAPQLKLYKGTKKSHGGFDSHSAPPTRDALSHGLEACNLTNSATAASSHGMLRPAGLAADWCQAMDLSLTAPVFLRDETDVTMLRKRAPPYGLCCNSSWLTRVKRTAADVQAASTAPSRKRFRSCAVVGTSGTLMTDELGAEIDGHDAVIRVNVHAKARGDHAVERLAKHVGRRSTWHVASSAFHGEILHPYSAAAGQERTLLICEFQTMMGSCFDQLMNLSIVSRHAHMVNPMLFYQLHMLMRLGGSAKGAGRIPTTGLLAVAVAMQSCDRVNVYGYGNGQGNSCIYYYMCHPPKQGYKASDEDYFTRAHAVHHNLTRQLDVLRCLHSSGKISLRGSHWAAEHLGSIDRTH